MDFAIDIATDGSAAGQMTFNKAEDSNLRNNVYLSLMIRRGSWFQNLDFGSRLHLLQREKNTEQTAVLAEEYCREALQWLIDSGRARKIDIVAERDRLQDLHRLKLLVSVTKSNGDQVSFTTFVEVV
jgi:phage gp46-like protein